MGISCCTMLVLYLNHIRELQLFSIVITIVLFHLLRNLFYCSVQAYLIHINYFLESLLRNFLFLFCSGIPDKTQLPKISVVIFSPTMLLTWHYNFYFMDIISNVTKCKGFFLNKFFMIKWHRREINYIRLHLKKFKNRNCLLKVLHI